MGPPKLVLTASAIDIFRPGPLVESLVVGDASVELEGGPAPEGRPPEQVVMVNREAHLKQAKI